MGELIILWFSVRIRVGPPRISGTVTPRCGGPFSFLCRIVCQTMGGFESDIARHLRSSAGISNHMTTSACVSRQIHERFACLGRKCRTLWLGLSESAPRAAMLSKAFYAGESLCNFGMRFNAPDSAADVCCSTKSSPKALPFIVIGKDLRMAAIRQRTSMLREAKI